MNKQRFEIGVGDRSFFYGTLTSTFIKEPKVSYTCMHKVARYKNLYKTQLTNGFLNSLGLMHLTKNG